MQYISTQRAFLLACAASFGIAAAGCQPSQGLAPSAGATTVAPIEGEGVAGTVRGTAVSMRRATLDDSLAIYEGDDWGFNPSLLIFTFDNNLRPGQSIVISPEHEFGATAPHIHFRWRNPQTNHIETGVKMNGYQMTLQIDSIEGDYLVGRLEYSVPDEQTKVAGPFRALLDDTRKAELSQPQAGP